MFLFSGTAIAQTDEVIDAPADTSYWDWGNTIGAQFGQSAVINWSQGGQGQISTTFTGRSFANYEKKKHLWESQFIGDWGLVKFKGQSPQINANSLELNSVYGYKLSKTIYAGFLANLKSQFTWGFSYPEDGGPKVLISKFGAPAYLKLAPGITYKPNKIFQVFVSPASGKFTFVREDPRINEVTYGLKAGNVMRAEFGALVRAQYKQEIFKNVTLWSILELFNNYTDPVKKNRGNIDIDWQTGLDMKINSWLSASILTHVIYDHDIAIPIDTDGDGENDSTGPRTQFRENFTLGLTYSLNKKK